MKINSSYDAQWENKMDNGNLKIKKLRIKIHKRKIHGEKNQCQCYYTIAKRSLNVVGDTSLGDLGFVYGDWDFLASSLHSNVQKDCVRG